MLDSSNSSIADKQWQSVQKKTFTKWVNNKLASRNLPEIQDISLDFANGVPLLQLLDIIGDTDVGRYNKDPKHKIQRVENIHKALDYIKSKGIPLTNIGAEDIADGNEKLVLGTVWTIILRFTISELGEGDQSAKEGLLLWCKKRTAGYRDVNVEDFTFSWQDGLAFCALIHHHRPDLIDFERLDRANRHENLEKAFGIASEHLGIPRLLDVEDTADMPKPDEKSIVTYLAQYFHAFSTASRIEVAGRRVAKFATTLRSICDLKDSYTRRARDFCQEIDAAVSEWKRDVEMNEYPTVKKKAGELSEFRNSKKRILGTERRNLGTLFGDIQTRLKTHNLYPFVPENGHDLPSLGRKWDHLIQAESRRRCELSRRLQEMKEKLGREFAIEAEKLQEGLNQVSHCLASMSNELDGQLKQVDDLLHQMNNCIKHQLETVENLDRQCRDASVEDNGQAIYSVDDLRYDFDLVHKSLKRKRLFLEHQMSTRRTEAPSREQFEEIEGTFRYFDKNNTNTLDKTEFHSCCASLGNLLEDDDLDRLFSSLESNGGVGFDEFVSYMVSIMIDTSSKSQLMDSFQVLSGNRNRVTVEELEGAKLDDSIIEFLSSRMEKANGGYDYLMFLKKVLKE